MPKTFTASDVFELLNGALADELDALLDEARRDCESRPLVKKPRKLSMGVVLTPDHDAEGKLSDVAVSFEFDFKRPKAVGAVVHMKPVRGGLVYSEVDPDNPGQAGLEFEAVGDGKTDTGKTKAKGRKGASA